MCNRCSITDEVDLAHAVAKHERKQDGKHSRKELVLVVVD
jgi:hypothetical protein